MMIQDSRKVDFKIQDKKSRSNSQDFTREVFFKNPNIAQSCFTKEFSQKFSKLPEYLLSGNRLPVSCNRLLVTKFDFKMFLTDLQCSKIFFKWCNRLHYIGNRLPMYLNVGIQIQL